MYMVRKFGLALILCGAAIAASAEVSAPASTTELSQRIKEYQTAKNCDGMIDLFYTEGVDSARKAVFSDTIRDYICGNFNRKIAAIAFQTVSPEKLKTPGTFGGKPSAYTLTPVGVVVIDYGNGKPAEAKSISFLYGQHDNKTYLITTKKADVK